MSMYKFKKSKIKKIALVVTAGGHFDQLTNLVDFYKKYDHFWITTKNAQTESFLENEKKYFIKQAHYKKPWTYLVHIPEINRIFKTEKPTHIVSTGSGRTALIPFIISKFKNIKFIYIETYSRVNNLTLFATLLTTIGHRVFTQWQNPSKYSEYIGPIYKANKCLKNIGKNNNYVFVTLGTRQEPFRRLLDATKKMVEKGIISDKVIVQAGHTKYKSHLLEIFDFCAAQKMDEFVQNARFVITQESAGIGNKCLKYQKKFIVMPRDYKYCELPSKSDMKEDLHIKLADLNYTRIVHSADELALAIKDIKNLRTGFHFDNKLAISKLTTLVKGKY